jgi:hypothetical protein
MDYEFAGSSSLHFQLIGRARNPEAIAAHLQAGSFCLAEKIFESR